MTVVSTLRGYREELAMYEDIPAHLMSFADHVFMKFVAHSGYHAENIRHLNSHMHVHSMQKENSSVASTQVWLFL